MSRQPTFNAAFWKWFGDSRVVDERGQPLVVYHGTGRCFTRFRCPAYFTTSLDEARREYERPRGGKCTRVIRAYLSIKRPATLDGEAAATLARDRAQVAALQRRGYDGVFGDLWDAAHKPRRGKYALGFYWIAFYPEQIKAVDNDGTWDADDPDMRSNPPFCYTGRILRGRGRHA